MVLETAVEKETAMEVSSVKAYVLQKLIRSAVFAKEEYMLDQPNHRTLTDHDPKR